MSNDDMNLEMAMEELAKKLAKAMMDVAVELGVHGFAGALVLTNEDFADLRSGKILIPIGLSPYFIGDMLERESASRPGVRYNLKGACGDKISEMLRTGENSGTEHPYSGELGLKGGLMTRRSDYVILVAFSGGTAKQDLKICRAVLRKAVLRDMMVESSLLDAYTD